jgi:transposase
MPVDNHTLYQNIDNETSLQEETAEMLEMRKSGMTYRAISSQYGMSEECVRKRLGLKPTRRTPYRRPGEPGYSVL